MKHAYEWQDGCLPYATTSEIEAIQSDAREDLQSRITTLLAVIEQCSRIADKALELASVPEQYQDDGWYASFEDCKSKLAEINEALAAIKKVKESK